MSVAFFRPQRHSNDIHSRVRRDKDLESLARENAFDFLERQLVLSLLPELLDSLDAVANVLLVVSRRNIVFESPVDSPQQTSRMLVCCVACLATRRSPTERLEWI